MVWPDLRFKTRNSNIFLLISVAIRPAWHEHLVRIDDIHLYTFQSDPYPGIGTASLHDDNSINYLVCNLGNFRENTGIWYNTYIYMYNYKFLAVFDRLGIWHMLHQSFKSHVPIEQFPKIFTGSKKFCEKQFSSCRHDRDKL